MSEKLVFDAIVKSVYSEVSQSQLLAIQGDEEVTREQPIFGVRLKLASINARNRNGHRLLLSQVKNAITQLGDRPHIPGNYNHETTPMATSTKIWIENEDTNPELWLEGVIWNRCLTEDTFEDTIKAFRGSTLGASFEIDRYRLEAAEDIVDTQDVWDHTLDGWALTLGCEPADQTTKGKVSITATSDVQEEVTMVSAADTGNEQEDKLEPMLEAKDNMIRVWTSDMALGFLNDMPCPECDSRYCSLKKADFENGVFEMECDDEHRFEVSITIKSKGAEATVVGGSMNDSKIELGYKLIPSKEVEDLKEYTDEQIEEIKAKAVAELLADQKKEAEEAAKREADLQAEVDKVKEEAEKDKEEAVKKAKEEAVDEYKQTQEATAKRIDELNEILPYESEEAKMEAKAKVADMSDEEYEKVKSDREKDKEIAELRAQVEAFTGKTPEPKDDKLPVGISATTKTESNYDSMDALARI